MNTGRPIREFEADRGDQGERLDKVLQRHLADLDDVSRTKIQEWVEAGLVLTGERTASKPSEKVKAGDRIRVQLPPPPPPKPELIGQDIPLSVLHEDEHLLVIDKPAGLVVHPAVGHREGTLVNALIFRSRHWGGEAERPGIVHRLDKDTSGVLLVARTDAAHAGIARLMKSRAIRKEYLAIVYGRPPVQKGRIDLAVGRDAGDRKKMAVMKEGGREATTLYEIVAESEGKERGLTLLRCRLITGRTHQIRVHMKAMGLPIVGDQTYGAPRWKGIEDEALATACRDFPRQALHAFVVELEHPVTRVPCRFEAPVPEDMRGLMGIAGIRLAGQ